MCQTGRKTPVIHKHMDTETKELMENAEQARGAFRAGKMPRETAYPIVQLYIDHINERGKEIAKRFKMKPRPVSIMSFMR